MLRQMATSKALKLISTCVCPIAGTALITTQVPAVRHAVHRATAPKPRAYALPKTRVRPPLPAPVQTASALEIPCAPVVMNVAPLMPDLAIGGGGGGGGGGAPGIIPTGFNPGGNVLVQDTPAPVPELPAWTQVGIGFALIGGLHVAQRRHRKTATPAA